MKDHAVAPGNVHFTAVGTRLQGIKVAKVIASAINTKIIECPSAEDISSLTSEYDTKMKKVKE